MSNFIQNLINQNNKVAAYWFSAAKYSEIYRETHKKNWPFLVQLQALGCRPKKSLEMEITFQGILQKYHSK